MGALAGVELTVRLPPAARPGGACPAGHGRRRDARGVEARATSRTRTETWLVGSSTHTSTLRALAYLPMLVERLLHQAVDGVAPCRQVSSSRLIPTCTLLLLWAKSRVRFPARPSGPRLDSEDGRRFSMMRRLRALPLLSVSVRC